MKITVNLAEIRPKIKKSWQGKRILEIKKGTCREKVCFLVKNLITNSYCEIDQRDRFLMKKMNGRRTVKKIIWLYYRKYGLFGYDKMVWLLKNLNRCNLLTEKYNSLETVNESDIVFKKILNPTVEIKGVDKIFTNLYRRWFKFFYTFEVIIFLVCVMTIGYLVFLIQSIDVKYELLMYRESLASGVLVLLLMGIISMLIHEFVHAMTAKHYGGKINRVGFMIYYGWPTFFVDTTDMWMMKKEKRIAVSLSGILTDIFLGGLASIAVAYSPNWGISLLLYKYAFISYLSAFLNLNPLLEWDGYLILIDWLGIACLRKKSFYFIKYKLFSKIKTGLSGIERIYTIYGVLAMFWSFVAIYLSYFFWRNQIGIILSLFNARPF